MLSGHWLLAPEFFVHGSNCKVIGGSPANDRHRFAKKEEKITLAAIRYSCRSFVTGISGFLFCQSHRILVFCRSLLAVETVGQTASANDSPHFLGAFRRADY